jgi:E3 ubiquitin-protein ligase EDD1
MFQGDKIVSLHTCILYSVVGAESGALFWWGVLPFAHRKKLLEKYANKRKMLDQLSNSSKRGNGRGSSTAARLSASGGSSSSSDVVVGSQVCMRNSPLYQAGSTGFTVAGGVPKVGSLLNAAWSVTDACRFKIVQPPKKPKLPELPRGEKSKVTKKTINFVSRINCKAAIALLQHYASCFQVFLLSEACAPF